MTDNIDRRVQEAFFAVVDCPAGDRARMLDQVCVGDEHVRARLIALLDAWQDASETGFASGIDPQMVRCALEEYVPQKISHYEIRRVLGRGGMAWVYEGYDPKLKRRVALKQVQPVPGMTADLRERFAREMEAIAQLDDPHVVRAYHVLEEEGVDYLVLEYVDGQDLDTLVRQQGPRAVPEACEFVRQAAQGLEHAGQHGVVHRDVKPANLLVTGDGVVKVADFGLALLERTPCTPEQLTDTGMTGGSWDYVAPEQLQDMHTVDIRADIYGLGCTLYFLLAGHPPFAHRETLAAKLDAQRHERPPRLNTVPAALQAVLDKMLAKDPVRRYQTPAELARALERFTQQPTTAPRARSPRAGLLALVLSALLVAAGAYLGWDNLQTLWQGRWEQSAQGSREFISLQEMLTAMGGQPVAHQGTTAPTDHRYQRFLTLTHLHNCRPVTAGDLQLYRQGLTDLLGYLAGPGHTVNLTPVDPCQTVYAIDLREPGWQEQQAWEEISSRYPYGLVYATRHPDTVLRALDQQLWETVSSESPAAATALSIPYVRADWFVATVSQDPELLRRCAAPDADLGEPIPKSVEWVARAYAAPLDLAVVASELGQEDPSALRAQIAARVELRVLGLEPLLAGGHLERAAWNSREYVESPFQKAAKLLAPVDAWTSPAR